MASPSRATLVVGGAISGTSQTRAPGGSQMHMQPDGTATGVTRVWKEPSRQGSVYHKGFSFFSDWDKHKVVGAKTPGALKCDHCGDKVAWHLKEGTGDLMRHLSVKHPDVYAALKKEVDSKGKILPQ
jgi:hypothetical protein